MKAQEYLLRVEKLDAIIPCKLIEKKQWRELALNITANMDGERVQSSGHQSKMADAVDKCIDMEGEIAEAVDKLIAEKREVVHTIERLNSPIEYELLHMRYIQHIELKAIARRFGKDYGWVTTNHGRALKSVQRILDEKDTKKSL